MSFVQVAASDHPPLTVTYELETLLGIQMGAVNAQKTTPEILVLYTVDLVIDVVDTVMVRPTLIVTIVSIMHIGVRMKSASVMNTGQEKDVVCTLDPAALVALPAMDLIAQIVMSVFETLASKSIQGSFSENVIQIGLIQPAKSIWANVLAPVSKMQAVQVPDPRTAQNVQIMHTGTHLMEHAHAEMITMDSHALNMEATAMMLFQDVICAMETEKVIVFVELPMLLSRTQVPLLPIPLFESVMRAMVEITVNLMQVHVTLCEQVVLVLRPMSVQSVFQMHTEMRKVVVFVMITTAVLHVPHIPMIIVTRFVLAALDLLLLIVPSVYRMLLGCLFKVHLNTIVPLHTMVIIGIENIPQNVSAQKTGQVPIVHFIADLGMVSCMRNTQDYHGYQKAQWIQTYRIFLLCMMRLRAILMQKLKK